MNAKHTPGPWAIHVEAQGKHPQIDAGHASGFQPFAGCGCCGSPWMTNGHTDAGLADARLIVAAPDMLAELQGIVAHCPTCKGTGSIGEWDVTLDVMCPDCQRTRDIIAKATGAT